MDKIECNVKGGRLGSLCICVCEREKEMLLMGVGWWASNKACYLLWSWSLVTAVILPSEEVTEGVCLSVQPYCFLTRELQSLLFLQETCAFNWLNVLSPLRLRFVGKWDMLRDRYERSFCFILLAYLRQHPTLLWFYSVLTHM